MSQHEQDVVDSAWHEAGHVVAAWAAGLLVLSVELADVAAALGRISGQTLTDERDAIADADARQRAHRVCDLAGDRVDGRRSIEQMRPILSLGHTFDLLREIGRAACVPLWAEADALVDERWPDIEAIATALLASPDLALYADRDPVLTASPDVGYPTRAESPASPPAHGVLGVFPGDGGVFALYCRCGATFDGSTFAAVEALHAAHRRDVYYARHTPPTRPV